MTKAQRLAVVAFAAKSQWSYQLIGDHFGITRCAVAGILFRHRHPYDQRIGKKKNKIGGGYKTGPYPALTAWDVRDVSP